MLIVSWVAVTVMIPTMMRTKLPWYLNTFYPVFALLTAVLLMHGLAISGDRGPERRRCVVLAGVVAAMLVVAESKLLWARTTTGTCAGRRRAAAGEGGRLHGRRVFCSRRYHAEAFVLASLAAIDESPRAWRVPGCQPRRRLLAVRQPRDASRPDARPLERKRLAVPPPLGREGRHLRTALFAGSRLPGQGGRWFVVQSARPCRDAFDSGTFSCS